MELCGVWLLKVEEITSATMTKTLQVSWWLSRVFLKEVSNARYFRIV